MIIERESASLERNLCHLVFGLGLEDIFFAEEVEVEFFLGGFCFSCSSRNPSTFPTIEGDNMYNRKKLNSHDQHAVMSTTTCEISSKKWQLPWKLLIANAMLIKMLGYFCL